MDEIDRLNKEKKQYRRYRNISLTFAIIVIMYIVMFHVFAPTNIFPRAIYSFIQVLHILMVASATVFWFAIMKWEDKLDRREAGIEGGEDEI